MEKKPRGRPKGEPKIKVVVSLPEPTFHWLEGKAEAKKESPAAYLARNMVSAHAKESPEK